MTNHDYVLTPTALVVFRGHAPRFFSSRRRVALRRVDLVVCPPFRPVCIRLGVRAQVHKSGQCPPNKARADLLSPILASRRVQIEFLPTMRHSKLRVEF